MELFLHIIDMLYLFIFIPVTIGYFPVLRDIFWKKKAQSLGAWGLWTGTITISLLYVLFHTQDFKLQLIFGIQAICIYLIFIQSIRLQNKK